jgi:hypothetical protein
MFFNAASAWRKYSSNSRSMPRSLASRPIPLLRVAVKCCASISSNAALSAESGKGGTGASSILQGTRST